MKLKQSDVGLDVHAIHQPRASLPAAASLQLRDGGPTLRIDPGAFSFAAKVLEN